jgi:long-chain acyl-CoA synthetase
VDTTTVQELADDPTVLAEVDRGVGEVIGQFNKVEQIKKWTVLSDDWVPDSEQLTATMKLKRRGVLAAYEPEIQAMYAE